jgi:hypothetical protein
MCEILPRVVFLSFLFRSFLRSLTSLSDFYLCTKSSFLTRSLLSLIIPVLETEGRVGSVNADNSCSNCLCIISASAASQGPVPGSERECRVREGEERGKEEKDVRRRRGRSRGAELTDGRLSLPSFFSSCFLPAAAAVLFPQTVRGIRGVLREGLRETFGDCMQVNNCVWTVVDKVLGHQT